MHGFLSSFFIFSECCGQNPRWQSNCNGKCKLFGISADWRWMMGEWQWGANLWHRPVFQFHQWCTSLGRWFDRSRSESLSADFLFVSLSHNDEVVERCKKNSLSLPMYFSGPPLSVFPTKSPSLSYILGRVVGPLKCEVRWEYSNDRLVCKQTGTEVSSKCSQLAG